MSDLIQNQGVALGIDLGSSKTVGAIAGDGSPELLSPSHIPTRLAVTDEGFVVGEEALATDAATPPLPYLDENGFSYGVDYLPLGVFLQTVRARWHDQLVDTSATGPPDNDASVEDESITEGAAEESPLATPETAADSKSTPADIEDIEILDEGPSDAPSLDDEAASATDAEGDKCTEDDELDEKTGDDTAALAGPEFAPTVLTVPGPYDATDVAAVERAAGAAGFGAVTAVRNPVAVAATELPATDAPRTVGVVDVGARWASFAVVTIADGTLYTEARTDLLNHGRDALDATLAHWLLNQIGREHDITFNLDEDAMTAVASEAHDALEAVSADGSVDVTVDLASGIDVVDGGMFVAEEPTVTVGLSLEDCFRALEDELRDVQQAIGDLLTAAGDPDLDTVIVAGDGMTAAPLVHAVESAFDQRTRTPAQGDIHTAAAFGAALLAAAHDQAETPLVRDTHDRELFVRAHGESGIEPRPLTGPSQAPEDTCTFSLVAADEDQLAGTFELGYRHRITGKPVETAQYTCSNIPQTPPEDRLEITVPLGTTLPAAEALTVTPTTLDDRSESLSIARTAKSDVRWLAHGHVDRSALADVDIRTAPSTVDTRSDLQRSAAALEDAAIARAALRLKNRLWRRATKQETGIDQDDLEIFLREFDRTLSEHEVYFIDPDVGTLMNANRHNAAEAEVSEEPDGTILEVLALGIEFDGDVLKPADVRAAKSASE